MERCNNDQLHGSAGVGLAMAAWSTVLWCNMYPFSQLIWLHSKSPFFMGKPAISMVDLSRKQGQCLPEGTCTRMHWYDVSGDDGGERLLAPSKGMIIVKGNLFIIEA